MTDERRQRRHVLIAIIAVVAMHASILLAVALAGEWRVWRFLMNAVVQFDVLLMLGWLYWSSIRSWRDRVQANGTVL